MYYVFGLAPAIAGVSFFEPSPRPEPVEGQRSRTIEGQHRGSTHCRFFRHCERR